jgi:AraC family transcriptional regulator
MELEIKQMPAMRLGTVRHIGPYTDVSHAFERLGAVAGPAGLFQRPGAAMLAIYHDDPQTTPAERLRADAAVVVSEGEVLPPELGEERLAAGRYAYVVHIGPYEELGNTWARFTEEWLPASEHQVGPGPSYEIYRNTPGEVPQSDLRTEMYIPVL